MRALRPAVSLLLVFTLLTGIVYPGVITGLSKIFFPRQAEGSLVSRDGRFVGSTLVGQNFSEPKYFWGRPSATVPQPYNGLASSGSNLGPLNPALIEDVKTMAGALHDADPGNSAPIPVDLVTASASGLDPEISIAGARYQVARVARVRGLNPARVQGLVAAAEQDRLFGFLGEPRVNVLRLNLAVDELK